MTFRLGPFAVGAAAVASGIQLPENRCQGCGKETGGIRKEAEDWCGGRTCLMGTVSAVGGESRSQVLGRVQSAALASTTLRSSVLAQPASGP